MTEISQDDMDYNSPDKSLRSWFRRSAFVAGIVGSTVPIVFAAAGVYFTIGRDIVDNMRNTQSNRALIEIEAKERKDQDAVHSDKLFELQKWTARRDGGLGFDAADGAQLEARTLERIARIEASQAATLAILQRIEKKLP